MWMTTLKRENYKRSFVPAGTHLEFEVHNEDLTTATVQVSIPINEIVLWLEGIEQVIRDRIDAVKGLLNDVKRLDSNVQDILDKTPEAPL